MDRLIELISNVVVSIGTRVGAGLRAHIGWTRRKWGEGRSGQVQASIASLAILFLLTRVLGGGGASDPDPSSTIAPLSAPAGDGDGADRRAGADVSADAGAGADAGADRHS